MPNPTLSLPTSFGSVPSLTFPCKDAQVFLPCTTRCPCLIPRVGCFVYSFLFSCNLRFPRCSDHGTGTHSTCLRYIKYQLWNFVFFLFYCVFMDDDIHNRSEAKSVISGKDPTSHTDRKLTAYPVSTSVSVRMSTACTPGEMARKSIRTD